MTRCIERVVNKRLNAQEAKNHALFDNVRRDPRILALFEQQAVVDPTDAIIEEISRLRNGIFFLVALSESLEEQFNEVCRFEAFYIMKRAVQMLTELQSAL